MAPIDRVDYRESGAADLPTHALRGNKSMQYCTPSIVKTLISWFIPCSCKASYTTWHSHTRTEQAARNTDCAPATTESPPPSTVSHSHGGSIQQPAFNGPPGIQRSPRIYRNREKNRCGNAQWHSQIIHVVARLQSRRILNICLSFIRSIASRHQIQWFIPN